MLLHAKNYDAAIDVLSKVLELNRQGKASEADYADASFLIGEAYFQSRQYLSARRHYREVLDHAARPAYAEYLGRSLSRLVDIALRTDDLQSLDYVFARLDSVPQTDKSGSLAYARAKALYARKDYGAAKSAVNSVPVGSEYTLQAQYLLGVVLMKETLGCVARSPRRAAPAAPGSAKPAAASGHALHASHRAVPQGHAHAGHHGRHAARGRSGVDGHRSPVPRDRRLRGGCRGLQPRRSRLARVLDDALRARLGVRAPGRLRTRAARARKC